MSVSFMNQCITFLCGLALLQPLWEESKPTVYAAILFTAVVKAGSQLLQREWSEQILCLAGLVETLLIHKMEHFYYPYEIFCLYNILKRGKYFVFIARDSSTGKRISISNIVFISSGIFLMKIIFFRWRSPVVLTSTASNFFIYQLMHNRVGLKEY